MIECVCIRSVSFIGLRFVLKFRLKTELRTRFTREFPGEKCPNEKRWVFRRGFSRFQTIRLSNRYRYIIAYDWWSRQKITFRKNGGPWKKNWKKNPPPRTGYLHKRKKVWLKRFLSLIFSYFFFHEFVHGLRLASFRDRQSHVKLPIQKFFWRAFSLKIYVFYGDRMFDGKIQYRHLIGAKIIPKLIHGYLWCKKVIWIYIDIILNVWIIYINTERLNHRFA